MGIFTFLRLPKDTFYAFLLLEVILVFLELWPAFEIAKTSIQYLLFSKIRFNIQKQIMQVAQVSKVSNTLVKISSKKLRNYFTSLF